MEKISVRCCVDLGFNDFSFFVVVSVSILFFTVSHINANCYIIAKDYSLYRIVACFYARCV